MDVIQRRRRLQIHIGLACSLLLGLIMPVWSQSSGPVRDYQLKAVYIFNFLKFIEWPDKKLEPDRHIHICVVGGDPYFGALDSLAGRQAQGRIIRLSYLENKDIPDACVLLVISDRKEMELPLLLRRLTSSAIVTVSDIEDFTRRGGMIGFVEKDNKIKLEINLQVARQEQVKIDPDLLELATIIDPGPEEP